MRMNNLVLDNIIIEPLFTLGRHLLLYVYMLAQLVSQWLIGYLTKFLVIFQDINI